MTWSAAVFEYAVVNIEHCQRLSVTLSPKCHAASLLVVQYSDRDICLLLTSRSCRQIACTEAPREVSISCRAMCRSAGVFRQTRHFVILPGNFSLLHVWSFGCGCFVRVLCRPGGFHRGSELGFCSNMDGRPAIHVAKDWSPVTRSHARRTQFERALASQAVSFSTAIAKAKNHFNCA